jgi:phosphoribosylformylglycinamidine synthase
VSDGGLLVALAEMALAGNIGARLDPPRDVAPIAFFFGEDPARYVLAGPEAEAMRILADAKTAGVPIVKLGVTGTGSIDSAGLGAVSIAAMRQAHEGWFPHYMDGDA